MKPKLSWICPVLLLAMLAPGAAARAQQAEPAPGDVLAAMMKAGWKPVAPGVLQREGEGGRVETFAVGPEGLKWAVREIRSRLAFLNQEYRTYRNDDVRQAIRTLRRELASLREDLAASLDEPRSYDALEKVECAVDYQATALAFPSNPYTSPAPGVEAKAAASFTSDCGYEAETYAYAYARAAANGVINTIIQETPRTGVDIISRASASVQGTSNCLSEAYSYARYTPANIFQSAFSSNTSCVPSFEASIDGSSLVTVYETYPYKAVPPGPTNGCVKETWKATASGGTAPYSYEWSVDTGYGLEVATGSSYSREICPNSSGFGLTVTVTDAASQVASDSRYVEVQTCDPHGFDSCTVNIGSY